MKYPHKNFKGQLEDEVVITHFRRHWIQIFPALVLLPVCTAGIAALLIYKPFLNETSLGGTLLAFGLIILTIMVHYQFLTIFRYYLSTVIITNLRVIILDKAVFLRDSRNAIDVEKILEMQKKQVGIFHHVFKFGTIKMDLAVGESINIHLVPQPDFYFKKMTEVKKNLAPEKPDPTDPAPRPIQNPVRPHVTTVPFLKSAPIE